MHEESSPKSVVSCTAFFMLTCHDLICFKARFVVYICCHLNERLDVCDLRHNPLHRYAVRGTFIVRGEV